MTAHKSLPPGPLPSGSALTRKTSELKIDLYQKLLLVLLAQLDGQIIELSVTAELDFDFQLPHAKPTRHRAVVVATRAAHVVMCFVIMKRPPPTAHGLSNSIASSPAVSPKQIGQCNSYQHRSKMVSLLLLTRKRKQKQYGLWTPIIYCSNGFGCLLSLS